MDLKVPAASNPWVWVDFEVFEWIWSFLVGFGASCAGPDPSFCMDLEFPAGSDPSFPAGPGVHGHAGLGCEPAGAHGDHQGHAGVQP